MATRKFLFLQANGPYHEEQADTDDIKLGGLTMSGAIAMGTNKITGLGAPTNDADAATKEYADGLDSAVRTYIDSVQTGFHPKKPVRVASTANVTIASPGAVHDGVTLATGDRFLLKDQGTGSQNGIYVYDTASTPLVRATDADQNAEVVGGMTVWVDEGTAHGDTLWVLVTNNPIVVGTTALEFEQFMGMGTYTGGDGIDLTASAFAIDLVTAGNGAGLTLTGTSPDKKLQVDPGNGIELATNKVQIKLNATNPGLASDGDGLKFRAGDGLTIDGDAKADLSTAGGLEFDAGTSPNKKLKVKLNGATLSLHNDGLSVLGLPSLFTVDGTAVGATVTAANLTALTDSSWTVAHRHVDIKAAVAYGETLGAMKAVYMASTGQVMLASADSDATADVVGIVYYAGAMDETKPMCLAGRLHISGLNSIHTPGTKLFLGTAGDMVTYGNVGSGWRVIRLGIVGGSDTFFVHVLDYGKKAA